jgi:hypothetical protein
MNLFFSKLRMITIAFVFLQFLNPNNLIAQITGDSFMIGDALPDAPELTVRGNYKVGVRTLEFINKNQVDILHSKAGADTLYDRTLKVEVWYPAIIPEGKKEIEVYDATMGMFKDTARPLIPFTFTGRALQQCCT